MPIPTTATTPRSTARRVHVSANLGSSLVLQVMTSTVAAPSASTTPPCWFNLCAALTAPDHSGWLSEVSESHHSNAAPSLVVPRASGAPVRPDRNEQRHQSRSEEPPTALGGLA